MKALLGITGHQCSGKDTTGNILRDTYGFEPITSSDIIREHIAANNLGNPTRPLMAHVARELRLLDPAYMIRESLQRCTSERICVSGIYSITEAKYFTAEAGGSIVLCNAPREVRYQRAVERAREGDASVDFATFTQWELDDTESDDPRHWSTSW